MEVLDAVEPVNAFLFDLHGPTDDNESAGAISDGGWVISRSRVVNAARSC